MTEEQWPRVKELFHAALEHPTTSRSAFLTETSGGDTTLQAEVERLLAAHAQAGAFIEASPVSGILHAIPEVSAGLSGRVLGHYEVRRLIGCGGMGEVYEARDTELGRTVALKVVSGGSSDAQAALRHEAQHASKLNHPHVCTIHEVGTSDGQAFIVMEYVEGQSLNELIEPDGLSIETTLRYGIQISDALAHAHSQGVIHRDLKSANVVVTPDGRAKVLDFGLARVSTSPDDRGLAGTLSCMAPELLRGTAADEQTDIWALGVLLYEMIAGSAPFSTGNAFERSAAILTSPPGPLPAQVPTALQFVIHRCLAKDPLERYGHATDVRSALEAVATEISTGTWQNLAGTALKRAITPLRAAAILGLLATAVGVGALMRTRAEPVSPPPALGASGRPVIAVMSFDNVGGAEETAWLSKGVPAMLLTGLAQTRGLDVVSVQRLQETLDQSGAQSLDSLDGRQISQIAKRAGAGAVLVGSIIQAGSGMRIDAQLEDLATGRVLLAESVVGTDLFAMVDQLSARIRAGIGFGGATNVRGVADVSTASLEAYRLYSQGSDARVNGRLDDAQRLLDEAVAIDPNFADAYLELAALSGPLGRPIARRDYLRKAAAMAHRLSERQRLILQVMLSRDDGNFEEAARLLDELVNAFPDTDQAYIMGFRLYLPLGPLQDPDKLLAITAAGARALPASARTHNLYGYALLDVARYPEAVAEFEAYGRIAAREPGPFDSLGDAYLTIGDGERALASYSRAHAIDQRFSHNGRARTLAVLGRFDEAIAEDPSFPHLKALILSRVGRYREARQVIDATAKQAESVGNITDAGDLHLLSSVLAVEQQDYVLARQHLHRARALFAPLPPALLRIHTVAADLVSGLVEVRSGQVTEALSVLASQQRSYKPNLAIEKWWHAALDGEIRLASRDFPGAAAAFASGEPSHRMADADTLLVPFLFNGPLLRDGAARVAKARGDLAGAIDMYRQLLTYGPQQKWIAAFEPRYVLELARLLEQHGQSDAARQEYRRFLEFWKHADSGLPELAEARRGAAR